MPTCKKCEGYFPSRIVIDGKQRTLNHRKYCLECSPFGEHNTKKLEKVGGTKTCAECGQPYKRRGRFCHTCISRKKRDKRKKKCVQYKGSKCEKCGYNRCNAALTFHHLDPKTKSFDISGNHCRRWEDVRAELDKCILLCQNCHHEIHNMPQ